jgi:uncharacterized protein with von Willebrand factor type A (vWA) domain
MIAFGRVLRHAGLSVGTSQTMDALRALELIGFRQQEEVFQALQSIFVTRREQLEIFAQAFHLFWRAASSLPQMAGALLPIVESSETQRSKLLLRVRQALQNAERADQPEKRRFSREDKQALEFIFTYSPLEILRTKDFAQFSAEEIIAAKRLLEEMRWPVAPKHTRRLAPARQGRLLNMRRTVRASLRHHGEMIELSWHDRETKRRPIAVLCDISGSMEQYSRMLLHFMHAMTAGLRQVETFVFGTRLTRITRYLRQRDIDEALAAVAHTVNDWAGGTRIGEALKTFNYLWGRRVLSRGAVVMIISDGWDRGDIPLLRREMERLSLSCHQLIWLNPLLGNEEYEPLTQGIRAALPFVDDFLPVHNLESLEQLASVLSGGRRARRRSLAKTNDA